MIFDASVIIPTYNRGKLLDWTLRSLRDQNSRNFKYEVIIVDDGSTDDTQAIVNQYQGEFHLKYFYQENRGYRVSKARNTGILNSEGTVNIFIDSGMLAGSEFIYEHCRLHRELSCCAIIGNIYGIQATVKDPGFYELVALDQIDDSIINLKETEKYGEARNHSFQHFNQDLRKSPAPWFYFWAGNISIRKDILIDIGLFDEQFTSWGVEDLELGFRIHKNNIPIVLNQTAEAIHIPHDTESEKFVFSLKNAAYFHQKHNCVESEMFLFSEKTSFNEDVEYLLANDSKRFDYRAMTSRKIFDFLSGKSLLVIGIHNGALFGLIQCNMALEYQKDHWRMVLRDFPDKKILNFLGLKTHFTNKQYEAVVITDFWRFLKRQWVVELIKESKRIAQEIYIIIEIISEGNQWLMVDQRQLVILIKMLASLKMNPRIYENSQDNMTIKFLYLGLDGD